MNLRVGSERPIKFLLAIGYGLAISLGLLGGSAIAHHSATMFDDERVLELQGTVKEFQWTNPHTWIQVMVENEEGDLVEWSIEGGGPNSLARNGWRPDTFEPGDSVVVKVHPMRNGAPAGNFIGARFSDGSTIGRWSDSEGQDENYD